jgi:hypothetical protein
MARAQRKQAAVEPSPVDPKGSADDEGLAWLTACHTGNFEAAGIPRKLIAPSGGVLVYMFEDWLLPREPGQLQKERRRVHRVALRLLPKPEINPLSWISYNLPGNLDDFPKCKEFIENHKIPSAGTNERTIFVA